MNGVKHMYSGKEMKKLRNLKISKHSEHNMYNLLLESTQVNGVDILIRQK